MLGRNKSGAFILATVALVLVLCLTAHCEEASTTNTGTSDQSKEPSEVSKSVSTNNDLSDRIKQLVKGLEYPDEVAEDFTRMAMDWEDEQRHPVLIRWKEKLSDAHKDYQQGKVSRDQIAKVEIDVLEELCDKIEDEFRTKNVFELSDVIEHRQANCLGYSQLIYISGNAVGLSVRSIDVLSQVRFEEKNAKGGHVACIVDLFDGQVVMADMTWFYEVSLPFKLEDHFVKVGDYWELKDKDNPLLIHRRFRLLDRKGLLAGLHNNRGVVYKSKDEYDRAIEEYSKAIENDPGFAKPYCNRGTVYQDKGEYDRAILDYNKAIEIDPNYAIAYTGRGNVFNAKGEQDRAIADHTKAIQFDPKFVEAYNNRGIAYANKGEFDRAILDYTKAIKIDPNYAIAYTNRGNTFYDKGEYDRAITDHTKAIEINPEFTEAYINRGVTYANNDEYDLSIQDFTKAIEIDPDDAVAYLNRAEVYAKLGKSEEAKKDLLKALDLDPKLKESAKELSEQYELDLKLD